MGTAPDKPRRFGIQARVLGLALLFTLVAAAIVTATSANPLTGEQRAALQEKLAQTTGKTILLEERVDESLLGGMKVEYAGKELDGSVAGRLETLRRLLTDGNG